MVNRLGEQKWEHGREGKHSKTSGNLLKASGCKQFPQNNNRVIGLIFRPVGINSRSGPSSWSVEVSWLSRWSFGCLSCWSWPWWVPWRRGAGVGDGSGGDRRWRNCRLVDTGEWNFKSFLCNDILILLWYVVFYLKAMWEAFNLHAKNFYV